MTDPTKPEVKATIGGKERTLRFDKRALFRLGAAEHADATGEVDVNDGAALFRRACIYAFCMLVDKGTYASAEDVAGDLMDEESEPLMQAITEAISNAQAPKEGAKPDPLSASGHLPADG